MSEKHLKLVLDTSTIISAFFWDGNEAELLREIEKRNVKLYISKEILDEIADVIIRPKFRQVMLQANLTPEQILEKIISISQVVITNKIKIDVCRDKKDNKFLECAEIAKADYIVSGDEYLLTLKSYNNIQIVRTSQILRLYKKAKIAP